MRTPFLVIIGTFEPTWIEGSPAGSYRHLANLWQLGAYSRAFHSSSAIEGSTRAGPRGTSQGRLHRVPMVDGYLE